MRHHLSILVLASAAGLLRAQASGPFLQAFPALPEHGLKDQVDGRVGSRLAGGWWSENHTLPFRARVLVQAWPSGSVRGLPGATSKVTNAAFTLEHVILVSPGSRFYGMVGVGADHWIVERPGAPAGRTTHLCGVGAIGYRFPSSLFLEIGDKRGPFFSGTEAGTTYLSAGYRF